MKEITRRNFLKILNRILAVTGVAAFFGPVVAYFYPTELEEMPSEPVMVGVISDLAVGESKTIRFGRYPAIIINTNDGLRAYSAVCTHFACIVKWDSERKQLFCPCHDGYFHPDDGSVISGPPPTALEPLSVEIIGEEIYIGGPA